MNTFRNGDGASHPGPFEVRTPPQNLEAERGVLGSCLLDTAMLDEVLALLAPEDFYRDTHQTLFAAIRDLRGDGREVDAITVGEELIRRGVYERVGGDEALAEVIHSVPHAANGSYYARIVRQKAQARRLAEASYATLDDVYANTYAADELIERAESRLFAVGDAEAVGETSDAATEAGLTLAAIEGRGQGEFQGVATGFGDLDDTLMGLHESQLILLAARPSIGKTALALNIAEHVACEFRQGVLFVSLEMGRQELAERLLVGMSSVDGYKVKTGRLSDTEWDRLRNARHQVRSLWIDDTAIRTAGQIAANAIRMKARHAIALVIVDYLQLIEPDGDRRASRQEQVTRISRRLKVMAKQLRLPVLALSQLNRQPEAREDRRPRLSDLRESGSLEQDADVVLLLHRPEFYDPNDQPGCAELIVAKNRNGATGTVRLQYDKRCTKFHSFAPDFGTAPAF